MSQRSSCGVNMFLTPRNNLSENQKVELIGRYDGKKQKFMPREVVQSYHYNKINDIAFPVGYSYVFATASTNDVQIWDAKYLKELLCIQIPNEWCDYKDSANQECLCLAFMPDGKSIIIGWTDGKIRAFGPQMRKLQYTIVDAHSNAGKGKAFQGVIALCPTTNNCRIVSGGVEGRVWVWRVGNQSHSLIESMKEHRGAMIGIHVCKNYSECISCSSDGSCVIWDLTVSLAY